MLVSCLLPTYNRFTHLRYLLNEAVESFLRQDYPNKELLICNDTPNQQIIFNHPQVRIINLGFRFEYLSDKLNFMITQAKGDILCRWDDDDICLPHRLSYSLNKLGDKPTWRAWNYFYNPPGKLHHVIGPGNNHILGVWRKEIHDKIGMYPRRISVGEDQDFNGVLEAYGINHYEIIPVEDVFYLYRWGLGSHHLSGRPIQENYEYISEMPIKKGSFLIEPKWERDYSLMVYNTTLEIIKQDQLNLEASQENVKDNDILINE